MLLLSFAAVPALAGTIPQNANVTAPTVTTKDGSQTVRALRLCPLLHSQ